MHPEILTDNQNKLLPLVASFSSDFGLVGGTAIALHLGHRRSIDFDLFTGQPFESQKIRRKISRDVPIERVLRDEPSQYTLILYDVQLTFFEYPYKMEYPVLFERIKMPDLLTLAAMKAFALGHRAKWKDYVDLYFITKDKHSLSQISAKGRELFGNEFNEKIFRTQLAYFGDVNYSEKVDYLPGFEITDDFIKQTLIEVSVS